jgi:large subunit ribosomal protein L1
MAKISKKRKQVLAKVDPKKSYNLADASKIVKDITTTKFDASVDLSIHLGVDPRKANQNGSAESLPFLTEPVKQRKFLYSVPRIKKPKQKKPALISSAWMNTFRKLKGGWTDVDVIITYLQPWAR